MYFLGSCRLKPIRARNLEFSTNMELKFSHRIVYLSAHYHNWWRHGRHIGRKNEGTVTATVFIRFSWNFEYNICSSLLGLGLHFSDLRHHLLVKMAVEKTVKTGSDVNSKTKCRFLLILTRWTQIYICIFSSFGQNWQLK